MRKSFLCFLALLLQSSLSLSQVSVNTLGAPADPSAMLDVNSTDKGMLVPRMSASDRDLISNPATGLFIFCTDDNQFYLNRGTPEFPDWQAIKSQWENNGSNIYYNDGIVSIGTSDPWSVAKLDVRGTSIDQSGIFNLSNSDMSHRLSMSSGREGNPSPYILWKAGDSLKFWAYSDSEGLLETMRITSDGKVGIGTANPTAELEVAGQVKITGGSPGDGKVLTSNESGLASWVAPAEGGWADDGAVVRLVTDSDKVGIGTSSPEFKLSLDTDGGFMAKGTYGSGETLSTSGEGTRLIWYPRKAAFRAGRVTGSEWDNANIGDYSVAMGYNTKAEAPASMAIGSGITASGVGSVAIGAGGIATGDSAFVFQQGTASGKKAFAGMGGTASGDYSIAIGKGANVTGYGSIGIGEGIINNSAEKSIAIGYYAECSDNTAYNIAIGNDVIAGDYALAFGNTAMADGSWSTAVGNSAHAYGSSSASLGGGGLAYGDNSLVLKSGQANGSHSIAVMGGEASGDHSIAIGSDTKSDSYKSLAFGRFNVGGGDLLTWVETDPLFEIGNGTSVLDTSNAFTILKNGNVGIGVTHPVVQLEVDGQVKITGGDPGSGKILTSDADGLATWQSPAQSGWMDVGAVVRLTTPTDKVGIGTMSPEFKLSLDSDGGIIANGIYNTGATLSTAGAGTRLIWYPKKAAFRAGYVSGSQWDHASIGNYSIALGHDVTAAGDHSFVTGYNTTAIGSYSTAMGSYVSTTGDGSMILGDNSVTTMLTTTTNNRYTARFAGGYYLYTNPPATIGASLPANANSWVSISDSSRKENFLPANGEAFLSKISAFTLGSWNYKGQDPAQHRHYGPMAQDFYAAFGNDGIGTIGNDTTLSSADFDGINFIAIQALEKRTREQGAEIEALKANNERILADNERYREELVQLQDLVVELSARMGTTEIHQLVSKPEK